MLPALQRQTPSHGTRFPLAGSAMSDMRPSRHSLAAAMFLCAGALAAYAQDVVIERQLKAAPGRDVRAGVFTDIRPDCTSGPLPAIRLATPPAHGKVNIKQCLAIETPALGAFYHASADYSYCVITCGRLYFAALLRNRDIAGGSLRA